MICVRLGCEVDCFELGLWVEGGVVGSGVCLWYVVGVWYVVVM